MGSGASLPNVRLPSDTVVVVTGGNTGIGYELAKGLAIMGAHVIIACRSEQRATEAIAKMKAEFLSETSHLGLSHSDERELQLEYMHLDLAILKSAMDFITSFKQAGRKLHILLCNAGIGSPPWGHTEDGYETQFQVNYLGHFLIIAHLLPIMQQSGEDCRIILTSSVASQYGTFDLDTIQAKDERVYKRCMYYSKSKLYQVMQTITMASRLSGSHVTMTCYHPGVVATEITRSMEDHSCICLFGLFKCCLKTPEQGAKTGIYLAVSPEVKGQSGGYYVNCRQKTPSRTARNETYQKQLWDYTVDCLKDLLPADFS
ncbi:WW domain-containing oxidoreductase-like isoform X2 [Liolophura sinensis]|uniref:WW domain-containing oxidoreductase-like isoform X2 n=1 Tax=Liolophura sinensis TaxID=3198878 RepID=UPI003158FC98